MMRLGGLIIGLLLAQPAMAQSILAEQASIAAAGPTISLHRVPITTADGKTTYRDMTITLGMTRRGELSVSDSQSTASPDLLVTGFRAGDYEANYDHGHTYLGHLDGPNAAAGGQTTWAFAADHETGDHCAFPASVSFTTGQDAMSERASKAGANVKEYAFGVEGPEVCGMPPGWGIGTLVGVQQAGDGLAFSSFTKDGKDTSVAVSTITYHRTQKKPLSN